MGPLEGVKLVTVGAGKYTSKGRPAEVPPPGAGFVTVTVDWDRPVLYAFGIVVVSCVPDTKVVANGLPKKLITEPIVKPEPFTVSVKLPLFTSTRLGERLVSTGIGLSTVKAVVLVALPTGVVMAIRPVVAVAGTVNTRVVAVATEKAGTATPFRVTAVAPVKLVPVTVTCVPGEPLAGEKLLIMGVKTGAVTVKVASEEVPPTTAMLLETFTR
jgi:hypothetical protein